MWLAMVDGIGWGYAAFFLAVFTKRMMSQKVGALFFPTPSAIKVFIAIFNANPAIDVDRLCASWLRNDSGLQRFCAAFWHSYKCVSCGVWSGSAWADRMAPNMD